MVQVSDRTDFLDRFSQGENLAIILVNFVLSKLLRFGNANIAAMKSKRARNMSSQMIRLFKQIICFLGGKTESEHTQNVDDNA